MKPLLILATVLLAFTSTVSSQTRWADLTPEERTAKIEAVRNARLQKIRAQRIANRQRAKAAGRIEARATRARDRALMAVWTRLTPEVRAMYAARYSVERVSRQPEWRDQTRAERIAAVTDFITNYHAIKESWQQDDMDAALAATASAYPELSVPSLAQVTDASQSPSISEFPGAEVPDLFTINRRFNWKPPHGQWMKQMLKDIDAAKAAGDAETYESLTKRYAIWAEQYLQDDR